MASNAFPSLEVPVESARQELLREVVHSSCIHNGDSLSHLTLVTIGEAGQGKSTLVNGLVGQEVAKEGHGLKAGTIHLEDFRFQQNDVEVEIWDTPGFGILDHKEEEQMFQKMHQRIKHVDLMLYCIRIDRKRWPERHDKETIIQITDIFTKKVWSHCLFVLTFANCVVQQLRPEPDEDDLGPAFSRLCTMWEEEIRLQLHKLVGMNEDELQNVRTVPVGSYSYRKKEENPWKLPDREDWFISFWIDSTMQIREAARLTLLQLNKHRLTDHVPTPMAGLGDNDQNSVDPGMVGVEAHIREVLGAFGDEPDNSPQIFTTSDRMQICATNGNPQMQIADDSRPHTSTASSDQNIYDSSYEGTETTKDSDRNKPQRRQKMEDINKSNPLGRPKAEKGNSTKQQKRQKAEDGHMTESQKPEHRRLPTHHAFQKDEQEFSTCFEKMMLLSPFRGLQREKKNEQL